MLGEVVHEENNDRVVGIAPRNPLGQGILTASLTDLGKYYYLLIFELICLVFIF
jgi:hypothetical protein